MTSNKMIDSLRKFLPQGNPRPMLAAVLLLLLSMGALVSTRLAYGHEQDVQKLNRFVQASRSDTPAMKVFREGRDFIEAENWQRAAERFQGYVREFPKDRDVDAALYWYAYALQKLGRKDDAAAPLLRLVRDFPNSSWRREAEAMLVVLGRGEAVQEALNQNNCEIKILALQSLFQANVERAIAFVSEVLKAPEGTCPGLKPAAVSLAGSHGGARVVPLLLEIAKSQGDLKLRLTAIKRLGEQNSEAVVDELLRLYDADRTSEVRAQLLRAFSESRIGRAETKLIEVARSGEDVPLRQYAIRYLGSSQSNSALEELLRIFDADKTPAIRAQILRALSERQDPRARAKLLEIARNGDTPELRVEAIRRLADGGKASLDDLLQLYASETNVAIKQGLIRAFGDIDDPRATAKLFEIARSNEPVEIRIYAIRRLGDRNDAQVLDQLISLYDAEKEMQVKVMLIRAFGDSSQKVAVQKLIAIARDSQMVELRKMAVRMLGESRDPEALKFLEDLLK